MDFCGCGGESQTANKCGEKSHRQRMRAEGRQRKVSPGCFATASAPAPRANYKESNASRLRQEIKGMTVTGIVRQGGARSKSSSPNKMYCHSMPQKPNSGTATPKNRGGSPDKTLDVITARLQNATAKARAKLEVSPDKSLDLIATPRSVSETSSVSRDTQGARSIKAQVSSGYVVDTRSKTLTATARHPSSVEVTNRRGGSRSSSPSPINRIGYGKPLVTSLNKKLTVMKDIPKVTSENKDSKTIVCRAKSPVRSWRNHKDSVSSVPEKRFDLMTTKSPAKGSTGNKLRTANTVPKMKPDDKVGLTRCSVPRNQLRESSASLKYNNITPSRTDKKQDMLPNKPKAIKAVPQNEKKSLIPVSHSPIRQINNNRPSVATPNKTQHEPKADKKDSAGIKTISNPRSLAGSRTPSAERKKEKTASSEFRDMLTERLKQPLCKDVPISVIGRPPSGIYSRSFKPQLEDIKSSFMLLNKKIQDKRNDKENKMEIVSVHKPKQFNEEFRKQQLLEIKKKFQSKHFFDDSKYDKIEGLNWISWK